MKKTKLLTECAVGVALAVLCSFIKILEMPYGGSISLTMLPLFLISFRCGALAGVLSGSVYGLLSMMLAGVVYHPMSILLDYVLAFGAIGIAGLFPKKLSGIVFGTIAGVAGRFLSSLVSGAVLFAQYAPQGQNPWAYSFVYQTTYLIPEFIICVIILLLLFSKSKFLFK